MFRRTSIITSLSNVGSLSSNVFQRYPDGWKRTRQKTAQDKRNSLVSSEAAINKISVLKIISTKYPNAVSHENGEIYYAQYFADTSLTHSGVFRILIEMRVKLLQHLLVIISGLRRVRTRSGKLKAYKLTVASIFLPLSPWTKWFQFSLLHVTPPV